MTMMFGLTAHLFPSCLLLDMLKTSGKAPGTRKADRPKWSAKGISKPMA